MDSITQSKKCTGCGEIKPILEFYGNYSQCKKCESKKKKERVLRYKQRTVKEVEEAQKRLRPDGTKVCLRCKNKFHLSGFYINRSVPDGLNVTCKECNKADVREYNNNNKEVVKEKKRAYYRLHKEQSDKRVREWVTKNPEARRKITEAYARSEKGRESRIISANVRRARKASRGKFTLAEWDALCKEYDNRCLACGEKEKLTVDHVVPLALGGMNTIGNIQPLCLVCNRKKSIRTFDYRK